MWEIGLWGPTRGAAPAISLAIIFQGWVNFPAQGLTWCRGVIVLPGDKISVAPLQKTKDPAHCLELPRLLGSKSYRCS